MTLPNYQEPLEKEDLDMKKKFLGGVTEIGKDSPPEKPAEEGKEAVDLGELKEKESAAGEREAGAEGQGEKVSEKMETARRVIGTQKPAQAANVADDAKAVAQIEDYEKKIEKLVEIALQKGPEHAIQIAQHLDKEKGGAPADNYTLDEVHDRLMEEELRKQLMAKGLLKEL